MRREILAAALLLAAACGTAQPAAAPAAEPMAHDHDDGGGHGTWGPVAEPILDAVTQAELDTQWDAAVAASAQFPTTADAEAAGYALAAAEVPGVGAHFINWSLIDAPFDPARPSMLLYDTSPLRPARLVGFSYWVRSPEGPPDGFAGDGDHWHSHHGLCFVDGVLRGEDIATADDCDGEWLEGSDRWMLHAWVVPDVPNRWGRFAPRNPAVCPADIERVPDVARCPSPLP